MSVNELKMVKREMWINGYLNGAVDWGGDKVQPSMKRLMGFVADLEFESWSEEQEDQENRNRDLG